MRQDRSGPQGQNDPRLIRLLSTTELAERFGVTRATIVNWCLQGLIPGAQKVGESGRGMWVVPEEALEGLELPKRGRRGKGRKAQAR